jgi:AraC family transcriptional regulator of arabinose operon
MRRAIAIDRGMKFLCFWPVRQNIGSSYPLFPRTGYVRCVGEEMAWVEGDLKHWNLYFTFLGRGEIQFPDEQIVTSQGDLLLLPPRRGRRYRVADPTLGWGFYFLHFRPTSSIRRALGWFQDLKAKRLPVEDPTLRNRIVATLEEMHQLNLRTPEIKHREMMMDALADSVLLRAASVQGGVRTWGSGIDLRIERVLERIHAGLDRRHAVDDLARVAGLCRSQFCLLFRAGTGRSPQEYVEERRLELARFYLITTAQSIGQISAEVGFEDPFYFSSRFKRRFDQSPTAARKAGLARAIKGPS